MVERTAKTNHFLETHNLPSSYPNCCFDCSVIASSIALTVVVARFFPGKRTFIEKTRNRNKKKTKKNQKNIFSSIKLKVTYIYINKNKKKIIHIYIFKQSKI